MQKQGRLRGMRADPKTNWPGTTSRTTKTGARYKMPDAISRSASIYYQELSKVSPVSDPQEERRLIQRWQKHKDVKARDMLVQSHLRFVITVARKRCRDADRLQDLIAAGNIGLLKAVDRYDLGRRPAPRFLTYAGWWIAKEISDEDYATTTVVHVPTHRQKAQRKAARLFQKAVQAHGPEARQLKKMDPGNPEGLSVSIDVVQETVEQEGSDEPNCVDVNQANKVLHLAISKLPVREQTVLNLYYGVKDEPRNFAQIANILEMCPERVRQIKINGVKLLKTDLSNHPLLAPADVY
jgi:RNA polymerase primary sigma factor